MSGDYEKYYIPKHLDEPAKFVFWTIDEAIIMLVPMIMGIVQSYTITGIFLGLGFMVLWKRMKGRDQSNLLMYGGYWHLPSMLYNLKFTPKSFYRFFIG